MKLTILSLAISSIFLSTNASAVQDDNKPLSLGQPRAEESQINIKDVIISGTNSENDVVLKTYARSKLVDQGPKTIKDIQAVATEMTELFFHSKGFQLSRIYLPVQTLDEKNAILKLSIVEGKYGTVTVKGDEGYRAGLVQKRLGIKSGDPLETKRLERGLLLVDDLPGIKVAGVDAVPGKNTGESDYTINLQKENKINFTLLGDNQGPVATGKNRYTARFAWENPTGNGDEIEAGITKSGSGLTSSQVAYSLPFSVGDIQGWKAAIAASKINYRLVEPSVQDLNAYGTSSGVSFALTYPVIRSQATNVGFSTQVNYQKLTDYLLDQEFNKKTSKSLSIGFAGDAQRNYFSRVGTSEFNWSATTTFGKLDINNAAALAADATGPQLQGSFFHGNASGSMIQNLNSVSPNLSTYVSLTGQYSPGNLDSSEKFVLTGPTAVRGYEQGTVSVDSGLVMNAEVRYNVPNNLNTLTSVYGFYDYGNGRVFAKSYSPEINHQSVSAIGVGVKVQHRSGVFASLSVSKGYGYEKNLGGSDKDNTFAWVQLGYRF